MNYSISFEPPPDFHPTVEVAGCFCEWEDKILYLKRHSDKPQGNTWGLPAGKLERGEDPQTAAARELFEEVGIKLNPADLKEVGKLYIRLDKIDYIFYTFRERFKTAPSIILETDAHFEARWITLDEALQLPLIIGGKEALLHYRTKIS